MGETRINIEVSALNGKRKKTVEVLVDTGATLTLVPEKILKSTGIKKFSKVEVELANGKIVKREIGEGKVNINDNTVITRILFGKKEDTSVLGTVVLEELGLAVDPIRRRLIPVRYLFI